MTVATFLSSLFFAPSFLSLFRLDEESASTNGERVRCLNDLCGVRMEREGGLGDSSEARRGFEIEKTFKPSLPRAKKSEGKKSALTLSRSLASSSSSRPPPSFLPFAQGTSSLFQLLCSSSFLSLHIVNRGCSFHCFASRQANRKRAREAARGSSRFQT